MGYNAGYYSCFSVPRGTICFCLVYRGVARTRFFWFFWLTEG